MGQHAEVRELVAAGSSMLDELQAELAGVIAYDAYKLTQQIAELKRHNDQIANYVQGLPTRQQYEAVLVELDGIRDQIRALTLKSAA